MRRLIWPLLPVLSLLWSCASDDTPQVEGNDVVYAEDGSTTLAAHTGSSVAYGDDGVVGSAGPGGDGGSGATPVQSQGTTTYSNGPGTAVPVSQTAVVAQPAFYWYKPWTWKYRQSPARPSWRPVAPRPVVVPAPVVPAPRPYVPAPVYVPAPRPYVPAPVYVPAPRPYVPAPRPVYVPMPGH